MLISLSVWVCLPPQVWEEGVSSEAGAIRLYAVEIVELLLQGLASQSWGRKKACAEAVGGLAEVSHHGLSRDGPNHPTTFPRPVEPWTRIISFELTACHEKRCGC